MQRAGEGDGGTHGRRDDRGEPVLALDADVEQAHPERDGHREARQEQGIARLMITTIAVICWLGVSPKSTITSKTFSGLTCSAAMTAEEMTTATRTARTGRTAPVRGDGARSCGTRRGCAPVM